MLIRELAANADRAMPNLSRSPKVAASPLLPLVGQDVWVTATEPWFRMHLRHVAFRQKPGWGIRVVTDADLVQAWLATKALDGAKMYDADIAKHMDDENRDRMSRVSFAYLTLVDIAFPPELLVVHLGVKTARNSAAPEVLLEALRTRQAAQRPTWVWDQPSRPILGDDHVCRSAEVISEISSWERVVEDGDGTRSTEPTSRQKVNLFQIGAPDPTPAPAPDILTAALEDILPDAEEDRGTYDASAALARAGSGELRKKRKSKGGFR